MKKKPQHLVVDGSNIATEGRQLPSLAQLEESVEAFLAEHPFQNVIVVVDATFGHRISAKERRWYEDAVEANRIITPPAGAIGRGDAFILEIARRANATVLSNDSFQEFHGTNDWLFDEGRLFGGKPVPHIGWVFVARSPVRGPTSRRAVKNARTSARAASAEAVDVVDLVDVVDAAPLPRSSKAAKTSDDATKSTRRRSRRRAVAKQESDEAASAGATTANAGKRTTTKRAGKRVATTQPDAAKTRAIAATRAPSADVSPAEAQGLAASPPRSTRTLNEPEKYERFRIEHPVGSVVELVIDRFSSHGAYGRAGDIEVYIPTKLLGTPPPQRARDVLHIGELVALVVERFDDATRGIDARAIRMDDDIAYYASSRASTETDASLVETTVSTTDTQSRDGSEQPTRRSELVATKKRAAAKKAPAKKKAPARKKAPAKKKAAARKAPAKRKAAAKKKAPAKRKAASKKKAAAKKAPAKRKAAAKRKAPAKKKAAAKRKAPAKRKAAAKRVAKRSAKKR